MAHKTKIDGTNYEVDGGKTLISGTAYDIKGGKTLVNGTAYDISFGPSTITFSVEDYYGDIQSDFYTYTALEGMTWEDFMYSDYNTNYDFYSDPWEVYSIFWGNDYSRYMVCDADGFRVSPTDTLIDGYVYLLQTY